MLLLERFYSEIESILLTPLSLIEKLQQLRVMLADYLRKKQFELDCITRILQSIKEHAGDTPWICPHIYYHEQLKFSVRLIFWPQFYENNPHEHKTWSVTGVLHNELTISTYQKIEDPFQLLMDKFLQAGAGQTGYLMPGCIHKIANPSHELSASIHIFNNLNVKNPEENAIWYPSPRRFNLTAGLIERTLSSCLNMLSEHRSEEARSLVEKIFHIAPLGIKLKAISQLYLFDPGKAYDYFNSPIMAHALSGDSGDHHHTHNFH